jgi:hypothetical protein
MKKMFGLKLEAITSYFYHWIIADKPHVNGIGQPPHVSQSMVVDSSAFVPKGS